MESVKAFHPIFRQIALTDPELKNRVRMARGLFDPVFQSEFNNKSFNGNTYYSKWYHELKIPTQWGLDIKGAWESHDGKYVNPEDYHSEPVLFSFGAQVPVGRNLIFNERRLALEQAKILQKASEAIQRDFINQFLVQLGYDFIEWWFSFQKLKLYSEAYELAKVRYQFMIQRIQWGDEAPIDSTEMSIQIQFMSARMNETKADYSLKKAKINTYLWGENFKPLELTDDMYPSNDWKSIMQIHDSIYTQDINIYILEHPMLLAEKANLNALELASRFARFGLLPDIYVGYSTLTGWPDPGMMFSPSENYKWNASLYIPLFLRKERAKFELNKIKQKDKEYSLLLKTREIEQKILALKNVYVQLKNQNQTLLLALKNSILLRDAEKKKFNNGESSVLIINIRENNLLDMKVRYFENEMKLKKYYFEFLSKSGVLYRIL